MSDSPRDSITVDTARLPLLLNELRLPTIAGLWPSFTERADREAWPAARLLATLAELELAERAQRRVQRHLLEARLPPGKTLDSFDFAAVPMLSRAHIAALASGDGWIDRGGTILLFGPSGSGKSHLGAALGHALIQNGYRVLFTRTTDLVQRLQQARQALSLESAIGRGLGKAPQVHLTAEEHREIEEGLEAIRAVVKKNVDIANVIGLVTADQASATSAQVRVKFAEETAAPMNMIAFD